MLVVVLAVPDVQLVDLAGPLDVFAAANRKLPAAYEVQVVGALPGPVTTSCGLQVSVNSTTADFEAPADTLVVTGSPSMLHLDPRVRAWLQMQIGGARRVAGLGCGAFLVTKADALHLRRNFRTCPSGTASTDLALALVKEDHGRTVAELVAKGLSGPHDDPMEAEHWAIRHVQDYIRANLHMELSVATLARQVAMSERSFARLFRAQSGVTPAEFVVHARVEVARELLETGELSITAVARQVGYTAPDAFRRAFTRQVGMEPSRYRRRSTLACTSPPP
jgi:transcriptional regulator GlxA family with amidase domain